MRRVIAVTFTERGVLHFLDPGEVGVRVGDLVLYPTDHGPEVARCAWGPAEVDMAEDIAIPQCAGLATEQDVDRRDHNAMIRAEALQVARELVKRHDLQMKVVGVDYLDRSTAFDRQVAIYFTAPERVDFRGLLGDLARTLNARIDLRQIGERDAARVTSGVGPCGRELCCATFREEFEPISIRLARSQGLGSNPASVSGVCGRLMCCLGYEHSSYAEFSRTAPAVGEQVSTAGGVAVVVAHSVPTQSLGLRTPDGELLRCPLGEVCPAASRRSVPGRG